MTLQSIPDLEVGITRLLHQTASPNEAHRVLSAFAALPRKLGLLPADERSAKPCQLESLGIRSELLQGLLRQVLDPDVEGCAVRMLASLSEQAAAEDDIVHLITDSERFPEVGFLVSKQCSFPKGC